MSKKICRKCGSEAIKIRALLGTYSIQCEGCKDSTEYYEKIGDAWQEWAEHHQKKLSYICECGTRVLTRWELCPICGRKINK